jgi:geranylgeranyl diphosphate synthase type II
MGAGVETQVRIANALSAALAHAGADGCPPRLAAAMEYAVLGAGSRVRPQLCLAVARACGDDDPALADAVAASIELLHCASLVHDDLPAFDNADSRRGKPALHRAQGEPLAILAGDALIVLAFELPALQCARHPERLPRLIRLIAQGVGMPLGIVAGQAWECEPRVSLQAYQQAKTGALFAAATQAGAVASGADPRPWKALGDTLGEAYQVADDIRDVVGEAAALGKPVHQDALLGRPSAAAAYGLAGVLEHFDRLMREAVDCVPRCAGTEALRALVRMQSERLVPRALCDAALKVA